MNLLACLIAHRSGTRTVPRGVFAAPLIVAVAFMGSSVPVRAGLTIQATFGDSINSDPNADGIKATINQAIGFYEANISTNITVKLDFESMTSGLGQSSTAVGQVTYSQYLAALQANASSAADATALATLPSGPDNPVNGTQMMALTTANLRALGLVDYTGLDSTISVNTGITNFGGANDPSNYGLLGVLEHEMDEALGLGSALDSGDNTGAIRAEDLFRFSAPGVRSFTTDSSATSYFSIDNGSTNLVNFNQVGPPGDSDYGDWATSSTPRVQDAFGSPGDNLSLTLGSPETTALDVIGYNFASVQPVPEPSSLLMVGLGLALTGWKLRPRRSAKTPAPV